jgi:hypothetical protein
MAPGQVNVSQSNQFTTIVIIQIIFNTVIPFTQAEGRVKFKVISFCKVFIKVDPSK